ncbi:threonine/serine exporter family protein [Propionivibrio limicola]|uniref:threonine/serine exporter family protein n=1 Tax=Propionivibrio limicola TaxID=167645 RepID=UPI0012914EBE|nr:threonine/serine exporter family protein [Propionivibrio limicola]
MNVFIVGFIENTLLAALAATGFGVSFNVPVRLLGVCAAGGAVARGLRFLIADVWEVAPIEWATFIAAATVSTLGVFVGRKLRMHPKAFTVAAMIPMIPGVPIFTALLSLARMQRSGVTPELLAAAINSGLSACFIVAALAVGLALPGMLFYRRRSLI